MGTVVHVAELNNQNHFWPLGIIRINYYDIILPNYNSFFCLFSTMRRKGCSTTSISKNPVLDWTTENETWLCIYAKKNKLKVHLINHSSFLFGPAKLAKKAITYLQNTGRPRSIKSAWMALVSPPKPLTQCFWDGLFSKKASCNYKWPPNIFTTPHEHSYFS